MLKRLGLYCDNLLNRDKYLSRLNSRIHHFKDLDAVPSRRVIDDPADASVDYSISVPEIDAADLTIDALSKSVREHGCLIVRNFFNADDVETMRAFVDHSFAINSNPDSLLHKYLSKAPDLKSVLKKTRENIRERRKVNSTYSNTVVTGSQLNHAMGLNKSHLTAQTPIVTEKLLQLFEKKQLKPLLKDYFGNEPCVSVYKWVLRRSEPPANAIDFHQDGAFMGDEIASLNCWIPLSNCGTGFDVHGLDIVPIRLMNAFQKGSGVMDWTISINALVEEFTEKAIVTPTFRKGDLLFFDHLLVHRSQSIPHSSEPRYAIETWFFDSVNFPKNQIPVKW
jgi:hypothetical protein